MTKRIIVAGAGHGGLVAAARLAKNGFDVTVCEKNVRETLGHDWEDRFTFDVLLRAVGKEALPEGSWRCRGDCAFLSPRQNASVVINFDETTRHKIMERKTVIGMLLDHALTCGVNVEFGTTVTAPIIEGGRVRGVVTDKGERYGDLIIDALGVNSPLRSQLPKEFGIENNFERGDAFYACRAYYNRLEGFKDPAIPFEVYLYHEGEQGLSWFYTSFDSADVLIGRIDPLTDEKRDEILRVFRQKRPWLGERVLRGGQYAVIPVRRPLPVMVSDGYAAVGDSAFMTTPMNGMGIDLSINAGGLLADAVLADKSGNFNVDTLWAYNRDYHRIYGGATAANEGLKNALLNMSPDDVNHLFENAVIQSADLTGAGRNMNLGNLIGKLARGLRNPKSFFAVVSGLVKGARLKKLYEAVPDVYDHEKVAHWQQGISSAALKVTL